MEIEITALQVIVPATVAVVVTLLTHTFSSRRDQKNKRREQRVNYLVSAYRTLAKSSNHPRLYEIGPELEQAVADIQLFGSPSQIEMIQEIANTLIKGNIAELNPILASLRDSLRTELDLTPVKNEVMWFRVDKPFH